MGSKTSRQPSENVTITQSDGWFVARDESSGIATQGKTKAAALENLADALRLHDRPVAAEKEPTEPSDAPWFDNV